MRGGNDIEQVRNEAASAKPDRPPGWATTISLSQIAYVFEKSLLATVVLDLALGGNGYLISIGTFRIREILFAVCVPWAFLRMTVLDPVKLDRTLVALTIAFVVLTAFGAALGYFRGNAPAAIISELKPLAYFPMVLFFAVAISSPATINLIARLLVACGIVLSMAYLLLLLVAYLGLVSYLDIFNVLSRSDEFIFRQPAEQLVFVGFLYKGAFYVGISALFLTFGRFSHGQWLAMLCMIALAMTLTRSLFVGLACSVLFGLLLARSLRTTIIALGQLALMAAIILSGMGLETYFAQQYAEHVQAENARHQATAAPPTQPVVGPQSAQPPAQERAAAPILTPSAGRLAAMGENRPTDSVRRKDIDFVFTHLTSARALLIGNGLGASIGVRNRIELNYLEILYKQGILGLAFWALLLAYVGRLYWLTTRRARDLALPFLLSSVFAYVTTTFNTFLTGSIGMGAVFISIGCLYALSQNRLELEHSAKQGRHSSPSLDGGRSR